MVNVEIISTVFGIIGNFTSFGFIASTGPIFYRILKNKSAGDVNPYYYLANTLYCFFFMLYGLPFIHPGSILMLPAYGTGLVINIVYVVIFLFYTKDTDQWIRNIFLIELGMLGFALLVIGLLPTSHDRGITVGVFCYCMGLLMNIPRGILVLEVVGAKRSLDRTQFLNALGDTLNAFCWFIYTFLRSYHIIAIPCGFGFFFWSVASHTLLCLPGNSRVCC